MTPVLTRIGAAFAAALLLTILHGAWELSGATPWLRGLIVLLVALAAVRPVDAVLILAGIGPVATATGSVAGAPLPLLEVSVAACLCGWSMRAARTGVPALAASSIWWPLVCMVAVIACSALVQAAAQFPLHVPGEFGSGIRTVLADTFFLERRFPAINAVATWMEGLGVFAATAAVCASDNTVRVQVVRMAAVGAGAAALVNIQRLVNAAIPAESPLERLQELAASTRISTQYADVNAAGSFFALSFFLAGAFLLAGSIWRRTAWALIASAIFLAAWLTGSRAAVAAILLTGSVTVVMAGRQLRSMRRPLIGAGLIATVGVLFVLTFPNRVVGDQAMTSVQIRLDLARVGLRMLEEQPLFGVGVGRFYESSEPYLSASPTGRFYVRENAHNNFIQILAETGIVGFAVFGWLLYFIIGALRHARDEPPAPIATAVAAGLGAFALTATLGHPMLTSQVSLPFWLIAGVGASYGVTFEPQTHNRIRNAALVLSALLVLSMPWRVRSAQDAVDLAQTSYGLSSWTNESDGQRYRAFTAEATLFIAEGIRTIRLPVRYEGAAERALITLSIDGRLANRVVLTRDWRDLVVVTPPRPSDGRFYRLDLAVEPSNAIAGEVRVGPLRPVSRP